ncbi:TonB-dependent receptor [Pedobacter cryoconitis]|uniref:TonB-linked SusC/RagA family outer membrane protein n=1 Tax=Pedobacter cryoconitis TaxID=188932 RepID=A0A7X0J010_9SPHI|nr:TonB-dependent receptor [Pedobacter cryoconitis]MBB6498546.1 TonB-linked SusC/RagA family outer membrane protein [Pedobacter cryoconitis]
MKLTTLLLLITLVQASAKGFSQTISLNEEKTTVKKVFQLINKQTGYVFFYDSKDIRDKTISVQVKNASLDEALKECFKNLPLIYKIVGKTVVIQEKRIVQVNPAVNAITVTGQINDSNNKPLPGVTVKVKDGKAIVITDNKGKFKITVPDKNSVLVFSSIGFVTKELTVTPGTEMQVKLEADESKLSEVVVVGYGTQKKINLTGAIATVGSEKLEGRPLVNLGDGLNGLIPNLNVNINNGQPGTSATFNIRGYTTIGSNSSSSPLVLVDGVQRDPNLIDPNDVANVTVLKDAASSAIYGSRAAYGVILITTKTGKKGVTQVSYSGSYTTSRPTIMPSYMNSVDYIKIFNSAQRTGSLSGGNVSTNPFTAQDSTMAEAYFRDPVHNPTAYPDPGNPKLYRYVGNTDWIKVLYPGWAPQQQHDLSISGGEGKTTYYASMGYFAQDGLEKVAKQVYKRYTPSLKVNTDVTSWLTFNLNMSMTHTDNNQAAPTYINQGGAFIPGDLRPIMPVYNPDGNYSGQGSYTNPVAIINQSGRDIDYKNDFWTTGRVIIKPVDHLTITSDYTWNALSEFDKANLLPFNEYGVGGTFLDVFPWTNPSRVLENRRNNNYNALNIYATYENTFKEKHYFKALVGYNQEYQHYQLSNSMAKDLIDPTLPAIGTNNDPKPVVGGVETESALVGTFFRLNYIYDKRYLLEVNGRYDGTSRFPGNHRYAFSPSVSAGWNITEESFMQGLKNTVNELKLRASYGQLVNQQTTPDAISASAQYPYIATQGTGTVNYLFNNQPGIIVNTPGLISNTLTWEKVQTKNIGLDYALLNNRLSGSFDYFITDTKDMLVAGQQLPAVLGTSAPLLNQANLRTKGWEFSIGWKDHMLDNKLFYNITLGLSDAYSTITKYDINSTYSLNDYYKGEKLGSIWGYQTLGYYKTDAEAASVDNSAIAGYKWLAGDVKYADLNHDGKIGYGNNTLADPGDKRIIGNTTPRYKFGFNLNLAYKDFDFAAFVQGVLKADFAPNDNVLYSFHGSEYDIPYQQAKDYWTPDNPNAYFARPRFGGGNQQTQTKYLQNAAYARIKQLTLGYSLPKQLINKLKMQKVRVYVTGANLFTITSLFKGYDPEIATMPNGNFRIYPVNKSVSFGLQATL